MRHFNRWFVRSLPRHRFNSRFPQQIGNLASPNTVGAHHFHRNAGHAVYLGNTCPWCHRVALALALRQVPERCIARVQCLGRQIRPQRPQKSPRNSQRKKKNGRNKDLLLAGMFFLTFWRNELLGPRKSDSHSIDCAKNVCFFCMLGAIFVFTCYVGPCSLGSKPRIPKAMNHHHRTTTTTQPPAPALFFFIGLWGQ